MDSGTLPFQIINISYLNCTYLRRMAYSLWRFMNSTSNIGEFLFESIFLPPILNDNKYRQFLETQLPLILEGIPLQIRNQMWFMHDEALAYFNRLLKSSWIIITSIDELIEEDSLLGLHVLLIWILWIFMDTS